MIHVRLEIDEAMKAIEALGKRAPYAIARAINRAAASGRTAMTSEITKDTGLKAGAVRNEIKIEKAVPGGASARLVVAGRRLPLIAFQARGPEPSRGRGKGVSYRLPSGRGRVDNAFIATLKSGHRGVFKRAGRSRLGITELHGPSLPKVFEKFMPIGQLRAKEALTKNLQSELRFALTQK